MISSKPDLSVVVPSVNGWEYLQGCLAALEVQTGEVDLEVIVADRIGPVLQERVRENYPGVRIVSATARTGIPALRALGFDVCRADIVGLLEDHVEVSGDWAVRMLNAHRDGAQVVGGSVHNGAEDGIIDRVAFVCEYSHCLVVERSDSASWVTGNNVTYRRELLERFRDVIAEGGWEDRLHTAIRRAGIRLWARPEIQATHKMHYSVPEYVSQRYWYARSFAGVRLRGTGVVRRFLYGTVALGLPPLLLLRIVSQVWRAGRHRWMLVYGFPLLTLFVTAWAAGEATGAWHGLGDSLSKVR